ncbi:hypothetical protein H920_09463 [Fukomys damarensis]|uniref:Uncharacterized protein n=1 Tax=Fukomys damarensis TaxID=885580 RepID=A0A091DF16_FUKDA|nr:hypothetical protein H920_09463 [Fukomys damarensis]
MIRRFLRFPEQLCEIVMPHTFEMKLRILTALSNLLREMFDFLKFKQKFVTLNAKDPLVQKLPHQVLCVDISKTQADSCVCYQGRKGQVMEVMGDAERPNEALDVSTDIRNAVVGMID